jgi:hypothetical protein
MMDLSLESPEDIRTLMVGVNELLGAPFEPAGAGVPRWSRVVASGRHVQIG